MRSSLRKLSLRTYITLALLLLLVVLIAIFSISSLVSLRFAQKRIYASTEDTVALYQQQADEALNRVDSYLYTIMSSDSSYSSLAYLDEMDRTYYREVRLLSMEFTNSVYGYKAEVFYDYLPDNDTFINGNAGTTAYAQLKQTVKEEIAAGIDGEWHAVEIEDTWYLVRVLQGNRQYVGAFVRVSDLLGENAEAAVDRDRNFFCLVDHEGRILQADADEIVLGEELFQSSYSVVEVDGTKCLVVQRQLDSGDFYLTSITSYASIRQITSILQTSLVILIVVILLIWVALVVMVRRSILEPVTTITNAMSEVAAGNLEHRIPVHNQSQEFQSIAKTYNIMVSEIKDLKIHVYEQQIAHARLETQYLKQQITPHFMINCLNTACQLTEFGELELARTLLRELSVHLRFVLSSGRTVRLSEELELVRNYIGLSSIRYPESLQYTVSCPAELGDCAVVPLMLLNHVENTIKHEVVVGEQLEIRIAISEEQGEDGKILCAVIQDTGNGFSQKALDLFEEFSHLSVEEIPTSHIGISNVMQRTKREFPGAEFTFSNHSGGGAQIVVRIPEVAYTESRKG